MYKILIADDERKLRETMRDYLVSKGFQIVLASDGEEALTAAFAQVFDLIILDVMMPGINGIEVCREIRRQKIHSGQNKNTFHRRLTYGMCFCIHNNHNKYPLLAFVLHQIQKI